MINLLDLSSAQLLRAAAIKEKISALEKELFSILGSPAVTAKSNPPVAPVKKKGGMSAAGRAKIAAAQKARWAKIKGSKPTAKAAHQTGGSGAEKEIYDECGCEGQNQRRSEGPLGENQGGEKIISQAIFPASRSLNRLRLCRFNRP